MLSCAVVLTFFIVVSDKSLILFLLVGEVR